MAFPFQDDFSVGTIHGAKVTTPTQNMAEPTTMAEVLEIDNVDNDVSVQQQRPLVKSTPTVLLDAGLPPAPTPRTALPPTPLSQGLSAEDQLILPAQILRVEPPGSRGANSPHCTPFYIHGGGGYTSARRTVKWAGILIKAQEEPATCI